MPRCSCVKHDCDGRFDWSSFAEGPRCAYNICLLATQLGEFRGEGDPQEGESSCQESQEGVGSGKPSADGRCRKAINGPCHVMHPVQAHTYYIYIYMRNILEKQFWKNICLCSEVGGSVLSTHHLCKYGHGPITWSSGSTMLPTTLFHPPARSGECLVILHCQYWER